MFEKFKNLFAPHNLLENAYDTTLKMLKDDFKMYEAAKQSLRDSNTAKIAIDIIEMDRMVNKYEREVRRNVLTHLSISGTANLVPGLVLVSIVVDVERIGDYTTNIVELARNHPRRLDCGIFEDIIKEIESVISRHFEKTLELLSKQDSQTAREVMQAKARISKQCDDIVNAILIDPPDEMSKRDAVATALYVRYLKRINSHLTNIASSIVNPFPRIGFREKKEE